MSIATAITAAQGRVADAYTAISNKGGTLPATQNLTNMPTAINSIPTSSSDVVTAMNKTGSDIATGDKVWLNHEDGYSYNFDVVGALNVDNETTEINNFSTTNYLQLKNAFNPQNKTWEVVILFITNNVTTQQSIFKSGISAPAAVGRFGVGVEINSSHFRISASSNGSSWDLAHDTAGTYTILANTTYWVKLGWSGTQYYLEYSLDGETYTRDITVSSSTAVYNNLGVTLLGLNWWNDAYQAPFLGTIDLSATKITIDGSDWWVPSITKISDWSAVNFNNQDYSYDLDIVGSPTIEYGVVSGFSSSNYLSKTTAPSSWNISDYTFYCKFTSKASSANQNIVAGSVMLQEQSGYVKTWNGSTVINLFVVNSGRTYWVKVVVSGTTQTFYYSTDGVVYTQCYTGTFPASTFNIAQVGYRASSGYYYGSIDLKGMYLKNTSDNAVWYAMADNSLTGFAAENIAVNAAGDVKTVLPT